MQVTSISTSHFTSLNNTHQNDVDFLNDQIAKLKKEVGGVTGNSQMLQKLEFDKQALAYLQNNPGASLGDAYVHTVIEDFKASPTYQVLEATDPHKIQQILQELTEKAEKTAQNPAELKSAFEYHFHYE